MGEQVSDSFVKGRKMSLVGWLGGTALGRL